MATTFRIRQAAELLGVSDDTVRRWIDSGRLPARRDGGGPAVVDGVVVAERGQTLGGRVEEAQRAGRAQGVSRLAVQLTDLSLVDGQQLPIQTQLISRSGPTSEGRDAGTIASTTVMGAAIGAVADWGRGAAIGAGVGAVAGTIGVLLTRGHEIVIYPESVLTFRIEAPVTISTERAICSRMSVTESDSSGQIDRQRKRNRQPIRRSGRGIAEVGIFKSDRFRGVPSASVISTIVQSAFR